MVNMSIEHVKDLLAAYALDSLDEGEASQAEAHLANCQECREALYAYQGVVDQLALAAPQAQPPAIIKQKLFEQVAGSSRTRQQESRPVSWSARLAGLVRRATPAWSLASLVLVVVLLTSNLFLWRQVSQLKAAPQPVAMRLVSLSHTATAPDASGLIVISGNGEYGTLVVDNLPTLNPEKQYQLWLIQDGKRTSGGVFSVDQSGYSSISVSSPTPLINYSAFGITIEPAGGSPGPTGPKVLGGNL